MVAIPAEIIRFDLESNLSNDLIPGGVTVGTPDDEIERKIGYIAIDPAGSTAQNVALLRQRLNVRCIADTLARSLELAMNTRAYLHERGRRVVTQDSDGQSYLVHRSWVSGGPQQSMAKDLFEQVLFVDYLVGENPT